MPAIQPPVSPPQAELVAGVIERVTFHSADSGFGVVQVQVKGRRDLVTVVGTLPEVRAGEWVEAQGFWAVDRTYGQQFKAQVLKTAQPNTVEGMQRYLASGLVKGIGPAFAARMVEKFGTAVFEVIEQAPKRLLEVSGIGKGRQGKIVSAWNDQRAVREIMVFLHSHGVGTSRAFRIYKAYGEQSIPKVKEDPYRLARDIWGIGFKTADTIAASLGIGKQSDLRARAGVEHALQELTEEGHCAFPRAGLVERAATMLEIPREIIESAVDHGIQGAGRGSDPAVPSKYYLPVNAGQSGVDSGRAATLPPGS